MRSTIRIALALLLAVCAAAQRAPTPAPSTAQAALSAFEAVRAQPESARAAAVRAMGRFAEPAITDLLLDELAGATEDGYRVALADALGGCERQAAIDPLTVLLGAEDSTPSLRNSAARGLARQGAEGVARLRVAAATPGATPAASSTRTYALIGLSQAGTEAAWRALAAIATEGEVQERRSALRHLERAPDLPEVTAALLAGARGDDLWTAASCARQLAEKGHADAADLLAALAARTGDPNFRNARPDLLRGLVAVFSPRFRETLLVLGSEADSNTARVLEPLLPKLAADQDFVAWLRAVLPKRATAAERCFGLRLLGLAPGTEITLEIAGYVRSREPEVVTTALRVLGGRGDPAAVPELRKLLRSKDEARRVETMLALHDLLRADESWRDELRKAHRGASSPREATIRALCLDLLAELQDAATLEEAWKDLDHRDWTVRAAAIDYCRRVRHADSVPKLILRLDAESGRLREDVLDALQALTAMRFMQRERWDSWWKEAGAAFVLIPADALADQKKPRPQGGATSSYYGIPLLSDRVVFVVDVSGSMSAQVGTDASRNRLDEAKQQLRRVLETTPKHFRFNVVPFHTTVATVFDQMTVAADRPRAEARARIDVLQPTGGTNIHDAMERAFAETEVDTIFLLSDGGPSAGKITDPTALADEIARWNRARRIRIHCISIGTDSAMMKRIAAESGGEYAMSR
jgi:HEAT repeat protein